MIQNLFNTRPKTFMDYESGKIPNKKDWTSQTTTQTQSQPPFASNVKIVGDDVTEKDYDTFFEGFNSAREKPLWQERKFQQEPKIQKLPGRPSVDGEPKIQKLPYRLSEDGEPKIQKLPYTPSEAARTKISLYSGATPAYTQVKNTYQQPQETWKDRLKETGEALLPYISPAIAVGKALEPEVRKKHYERNQYNVDLPKNADEAKAWDWETELANCHQFTADGERYIKYVSPDGKREVIFNEKGDIVITADEDMGTYNYADPKFLLEHGLLDVLPWILYGNTPEDPTKWYQRIGGLFDFD